MRLLLVAFANHEIAAGAALAAALGFDFDAVFLPDQPADALCQGLESVSKGYTHIAAVSSMVSKDVLARFAGLTDAAMVTDATGCESPTIFQRPIVAGTLIETVEVLQTPVVLTFRPAGFVPSGNVPGQILDMQPVTSKAVRISSSVRGGQRPDLTQAKVIISGGRPLRDAATFEAVIGGFADALGGAAGATRAAVDSGIAANELQIGQTGKIVAPNLYIAAGISGSTQHMAGIKDSKIIVAINKDPDAPIFEFADLGLVADLFVAVPELQAKLKS